MKAWTIPILALVLAAVAVAWSRAGTDAARSQPMNESLMLYNYEQDALVESAPVVKSEAEWKRELTAEQFRVLRGEGTECAFTGALEGNKKEGLYRCAACGTDLFVSTTKFESGTGWPSFFQPVHPNNIGTSTDYKIGYARTEVHCARCGGHLGHVFEDGPRPTGLRYCINSAAMIFTEMPIRERKPAAP